MSGAILRRRDRTARTPRVEHYWAADNNHRVNVAGTRNVLAAAEAARVERLVHTNTWVVVGRRTQGSQATEDTQPSRRDLRGAYRRTKWLAEQEVQAAVARGQDVVIASPAVPIGPWDVKPTPTGRIVLDFIRAGCPCPSAFPSTWSTWTM